MTRQEMLDKAQALIDDGNFEEAEKLMNDAEKAAKTQANLNAMTKDHASDTMKNIIERNETTFSRVHQSLQSLRTRHRAQRPLTLRLLFRQQPCRESLKSWRNTARSMLLSQKPISRVA